MTSVDIVKDGFKLFENEGSNFGRLQVKSYSQVFRISLVRIGTGSGGGGGGAEWAVAPQFFFFFLGGGT